VVRDVLLSHQCHDRGGTDSYHSRTTKDGVDEASDERWVQAKLKRNQPKSVKRQPPWQ
jgi:hypothetical protein